MEIDKDELFWEQMARANWLKVGDKNSAFFHKSLPPPEVSRLEIGGREITESNVINETATSFFQKLFTSNGGIYHIS